MQPATTGTEGLGLGSIQRDRVFEKRTLRAVDAELNLIARLGAKKVHP